MILDGFDSNSIAAGARCIRAGGLLGLPTETVYGLAADAEDDTAVARIFRAKGRPADHPLIVHVAGVGCVSHFAAEVPDFANQLMQAFWPGPLTLILPRRPGVASAAAGGHDTIGLRCPAHPVAQALLRALLNDSVQISRQAGVSNEGQIPINPEFSKSGEKELESDPNSPANSPEEIQLPPAGHLVWGIAAPSANQFGRVSPTTAEHVQGEFDPDLLILDGGACSVGIESTIIDCTRGAPVLLRPGAITPAQVQAVCGFTVLLKNDLMTDAAPSPKAPGTLESHYAPKAKVRLMDAKALRAALADCKANEPCNAGERGNANANANDKVHVGDVDAKKVGCAGRPSIAVYARSLEASCSPGLLWQCMPVDAVVAARELFAVLRELDVQGVQQIWIEAPPADAEWDGVRDRLQRAAS